MRNASNLGSCLRFLAILGLCFSHSAQGATLDVSPSTIANDYVGKVTLTISGLTPGQSVRVERFFDLNGNGAVDAPADGLNRTFTVKDGVLPVIGGVRNLNVPGDDDGAINGQIRVDLDSPGIDTIFNSTAGHYTYRISDPLNVFSTLSKSFTITQHPYPQGVRGRITAAADGSALASAFVVLLGSNGIALGGAFTDASGGYEIQTQPGDYQVIPLRTGSIANGGGSSVSVSANQFKTNNQAMAAALFTISGRVKDSVTGAGISGVHMLAQSDGSGFSLSNPSDADGNYSISASSGQWQLETPGDGLAELGYLRPAKINVTVAGANALNVDVSAPKATALIYGKVKDSSNQPINGIVTRTDDQSNHIFESAGRSFGPNGDYTMGVIAGNWWVNVESDSLPAGYLPTGGSSITIGAGQAVEVNLALSSVTAHLSGKVVDAGGSPLSGLTLQASPQNGGGGPQTVTAGDGSFDLGVAGGAWNLQLNQDDNSPKTLIGPQLHFNVVNGVNINNISFVVLAVAGRIEGTISDSQGNPVSGPNVYVYADATIKNAYYHESNYLDGNGRYSIPIPNGNWRVVAECQPLNAIGYACPIDQNVTISGANKTVDFTVTAQGGVRITTSSTLPAATLNTGYFTQLQASGGAPNYTWSLLSNLPGGLSLNNGNGIISGTPTVSGTFSFTVKVTDSANRTATQTCSLSVNAGGGPDVAFYAISKQASFVQTSSGAPTLETGSPFTFSVNVNAATSASVTVASVKLPSGASQALSQSAGSSQFGFKASFATQGSLDAAYPSGAYLLSFNTQHDGNKSVNDAVPTTAFPIAPRLSNYSAAQAINPAADFTLNWDSFGGTTADFVKIEFTDQTGQTLYATPDIWLPDALDGTVTSFLIPANSLSSGKTYSVKLQFAKLTTRDTVTYPGVLGVVGFVTKTKFNISTTGTSDTTPPSLLSSSPANGASGVALNSSVVFNFSEPMQSGFSINWSVPQAFSFSWSGDGRQLICNNNTLPPDTQVTWVLNPSGAGQNFRDVAGNPLPSNVSGSFTTEADPNAVVGKWTYKPFMPTARVAPRAATLNGLLYVVGGFGSGNTYDTLEVYDPSRGTWKGLAPLPTPRASPAVGVINGKLYVAGGYVGGTVLEVYDPVSNTWTTKRPMSINHQGGTGGVIDNKFYVVGASTDFTKSLEVYDPVTDTWEDRTPMPNPRAAGAAVLNGLLYTVGGDSSGTVEVYDPSIDDWTQVASLPGGGNVVYDPGVAAMDGKLYVVGGYNNGANVEVYDPASNRWSSGPSMLNARGELAVAALSDRLFAVGGVGAPGQNPLPFMEQLALSDADAVTTVILKSDGSTLAAGLGSGVPSSAKLARLNAGDTTGLTFQTALLGTEVVNSIYFVEGMPQDTQIIKIPPGEGQNGFFQLSFTLPPDYSGAQISCGATMDYYGRAFLNGNALTPAIDASQQIPALGTIKGGLGQDTFFSSMNPAFFHAGVNTLLFADINANGGPSAGSFYCFATYAQLPQPPTLANPIRVSASQFQFTVEGESGVKYRIESTTKLAPPITWSNLGTNTAAAGSFNFTDTSATGSNTRFYRAVRLP